MLQNYNTDDNWISKALNWSKQFKAFNILVSNANDSAYSMYEFILFAGCKDAIRTASNDKESLSKLDTFVKRHSGSWITGYLTYELKDEVEPVKNLKDRSITDSKLHFFIPEIIIYKLEGKIHIEADNPEQILSEIQDYAPLLPSQDVIPPFKPRISKQEYLSSFNQLKNYIAKGDLYQANFCQEFYRSDIKLNDLESLYFKLTKNAPSPFSCFFKYESLYVLSASPERYFQKKCNQIISQPIKGTAPRDQDLQKDLELKEQLLKNIKERSENLMVVDLVRNDLSKISIPGTVNRTKNLQVQSYSHVHQLVSTVQGELPPNTSLGEILGATFPPGSMTGTPKKRALEIIEELESSNRGVYSGSIGYQTPWGDMDFNVVIRTLIYDRTKEYLSFHVGGGITQLSDGEKEYEECLIKASTLLDTLDTCIQK